MSERKRYLSGIDIDPRRGADLKWANKENETISRKSLSIDQAFLRLLDEIKKYPFPKDSGYYLKLRNPGGDYLDLSIIIRIPDRL